MMRKELCLVLISLLCVAGLLGSVSFVEADPPRLPPSPQPPCPLVCLQITDFEEVAPDTWRFEFESLNWTAFTSPSTGSSRGVPAEGLVFVRNAALSTVDFRVLPVDANGAPLGTEMLSEQTSVVRFPTGELGIDLGRGFVADVERIFDETTLDAVPAACFELRDPLEGIIVLSEDALCGPVVASFNQVTVLFTADLGDQDPANTWVSSSCTANQIIWAQDPGVEPPLTVPPAVNNQRPCPATCADKDSGDNVLDGFVIEVEDFKFGDQLVFNWYLLGDGGPIALGSAPTPTEPGSFQPSPANDPLGFSFGSFQIDRILANESCAAGDCNTALVTSPPVSDPSLNCLVDENLDRNALPFDVFASLNSVGTARDCRIEPIVARDTKGIERLVVLATAGATTDEIRVTFTNRDNNLVEKTVQESLSNASLEIGTETLVGRYKVGGFCRNSGTGQIFDLNTFDMAIPRRGDLAELDSVSSAFEIDPATGDFALTGSYSGTLDLGNVVEACHFVQVRDANGSVRIFGTEGPAEVLQQHSGLLVRDVVAPQVSCEPPITVGTSADGGADCEVTVTTTAIATDAAGGFVLTNDLQTAKATRSFGAAVGGQEVAVQTATGTFTIGPPSPVTFTVTADNGQTDSCVTPVEVLDDTPPVVECRLLPDSPPPGPGGGPGGGGTPPGQGGTPPGQGGTPPGQGGGSQAGPSSFFIVDFSAGDNCDGGSLASLTAEIDGVTVINGQAVQITLTNNPPVESSLQNGRLQIKTNLDGVLTVTATDQASNVSVCETVPLRP